MKKVLLALIGVVLVSSVYGGQKNMYVGGDFTGPPNFLTATDPVYYRDGVTPIDRGCLLQNMREYSSAVQMPPVTNSAQNVTNWFVDFPSNLRGAYNDGRLPDDDMDPGNDPLHPHKEGGAGSFGTENGLGGTAGVTAGNFKFSVNGENNKLGWIRAFSGTHWTNSVYYGDGDQYPLPSVADYVYSGDTIVTNINPVYIIQFTVSPPTQTVDETVSGQVHVGTGNNELDADVVLVEWRETSYAYSTTNGWTVLDDSLASDGSFSSSAVPGPYPHTVHVRARVKDSKTPRIGYPISADYTVVVMPEPGLFSIAGIACALFIRRRMN
jgi:hypothetical protein